MQPNRCSPARRARQTTGCAAISPFLLKFTVTFLAAFTASVCNLRPESRGHVRLKGPDPLSAPAIRPNYLSAERDRQVAVESIKLTRRIVSLSRMLHVHPEATEGRAQDAGNKLALEREAEADHDPLIPTLRAVA